MKTNIVRYSKDLSPFFIFLLGLARAKLTQSEIILIDGLPYDLLDIELNLLKNLLIKLSKTRTIIIFSQNGIVDDITNNIITIKNNELLV